VTGRAVHRPGQGAAAPGAAGRGCGHRGTGTPGGDAAFRRYRDPAFGAIAVKLLPGECYVTRRTDEMLVTVLGSCIAACIRDPHARVGGMNHFLLPAGAAGNRRPAGDALRYGDLAMDHLIRAVVAAGGCRTWLEVKVFGGAHVLGCTMPIGDRNAAFVEAYLAANALRIAAGHLRGAQARRIHYFPLTGEVFMRELRRPEPDTAAAARDRWPEVERRPASGIIAFDPSRRLARQPWYRD
jgi:chemotaxis protein CheD